MCSPFGVVETGQGQYRSDSEATRVAGSGVDLVDEVDEFHVDGIVYHPIKSCRTVSTGLADNRRAVMAARDIATLFIESDMMDKRVVSEAQMKNRIDAFFEGLATRKLHAAAAA